MNRAVTALRIIDTGVKPARWNVAATAALIELHRIGATPDTIRFHRYPRSVVIARGQKLEREVDVERCRRDGVEIARRMTGGAAAYMSPGTLVWDIVAGRARFGDSLDDVTLRVGGAVAAGLRRLGFAAKAGARGAVEIEGRKVSESDGRLDGPTAIVQGTMLVDFDYDEMMRLLKARPDTTKPVAPIASLADCLGRAPPIEDVRDAIMVEFNDIWDGASVTSDLRTDELALADKLLADEIGRDDFVMGTPAS
ncbi:lipoate--protein ligase family protein [Rhodoplanes sp. Z2-YC6860]|uniref:lipoate--protein ligase family protein n=1 Tax=Rhodoplanes sp. Z2-YC6860 TaxID=674703 RepID=UPI00078CE916|nr:biotin/lipoate A/B protein ligase family protein [Rhodoplanes sp. Z2-YC6860]AMN39176.1 biotin/lipoate A/B protein ligase [Rhodoplanes sp. Z2-YC6860]